MGITWNYSLKITLMIIFCNLNFFTYGNSCTWSLICRNTIKKSWYKFRQNHILCRIGNRKLCLGIHLGILNQFGIYYHMNIVCSEKANRKYWLNIWKTDFTGLLARSMSSDIINKNQVLCSSKVSTIFEKTAVYIHEYSFISKVQ